MFVLLQPHGPAVEAGDLVFDRDPRAEWEPTLRVLHTGVRALLTLRPWWGASSDTPRVIVLNPAAPIPVGITLLCVEGDARWDRIDPAARIDIPQLFDRHERTGKPAQRP
jgi:hypothetical protein